jgi:hypothetical protein
MNISNTHKNNITSNLFIETTVPLKLKESVTLEQNNKDTSGKNYLSVKSPGINQSVKVETVEKDNENDSTFLENTIELKKEEVVSDGILKNHSNKLGRELAAFEQGENVHMVRHANLFIILINLTC